MAGDSSKRYPSMPANSWWALRKRFRNTIPRDVDKSYLAPVLGMSEESARANVLPALELTKIIDGDGKPTERAVKWRDDAQYPQVCADIRKEIYPQQLLDIAPDTSVDLSVIKQWFANNTGFGQAAVNKISSFYYLLLDADPSKEIDTSGASNTRQAKPPNTTKAKEPSKKDKPEPEVPVASTPPAEPEKVLRQPSLHLNIQIHISPDFTAEQIDQIFASMAKHLKDFS